MGFGQLGQVDPSAIDNTTGLTYGQEQLACPGVWDAPTGTCNATAIGPSATCMPQGWFGPLAPGQSYCAAPTTTTTPATTGPNPGATAAACPSGATCSIVPGVPNTNIYFAVAAIASLFFFATAMGGHR
jgi:hypothetical protein